MYLAPVQGQTPLRMLHMKFGPAVSEEKTFEYCGQQRLQRQRRTTEHGYILYKLTL